MINLAGNPNADDYIREELTRCGIDIVEIEGGNTEVPYTLIGNLDGLVFRRSWYYWSVVGDVPLNIARKLYGNRVGKTDIRVAGHCGCPPPDKWVEWKSEDGLMLIPREEYDRIQKMIADTSSPKAATFYESWLEGTRILEDTPEDERVGVITSYHIDSELGLYIFANTIKGYML